MTDQLNFLALGPGTEQLRADRWQIEICAMSIEFTRDVIVRFISKPEIMRHQKLLAAPRAYLPNLLKQVLKRRGVEVQIAGVIAVIHRVGHVGPIERLPFGLAVGVVTDQGAMIKNDIEK